MCFLYCNFPLSKFLGLKLSTNLNIYCVYVVSYLTMLCCCFLKKTQYVVFAFLNPYINKGTQTLRTPICF